MQHDHYECFEIFVAYALNIVKDHHRKIDKLSPRKIFLNVMFTKYILFYYFNCVFIKLLLSFYKHSLKDCQDSFVKLIGILIL